MAEEERPKLGFREVFTLNMLNMFGTGPFITLPFLLDSVTPAGPHARYDVTRPDAHHRWLFRCAGLEVHAWEHWGETTAWVLGPTEAAKAEATRLEQPTLEAPTQ